MGWVVVIAGSEFGRSLLEYVGCLLAVPGLGDVLRPGGGVLVLVLTEVDADG